MKNKAYANFNELVFEDRNKFYGAYLLRKQYEDNLLIGLLFGLVLVGSVVAIPYIRDMFKTDDPPLLEVPYDNSHTLTHLKDDPIVLPDEPKQQPQDEQPTAAAKAFTTFTLSDNASSNITTIEDLTDVQPGTEDIDGIIGIPMPPNDNKNERIIGGGTGTETYEFVKIEKKPEFPGGDEAMYAYFGQNINYPERAKSLTISGVVYVSFVIDEFGGIRDVNLLRGIGGGCDEEAMRVIKNMPRWSPGKQGGHPVRVKYQLPVYFALN